MPSEDGMDFFNSAIKEIERLAKIIEGAEALGELTPASASIHRLWLAVLHDPKSRMSDRTRAIEHLGKLQSLYVERVSKQLDLPPNMPMTRLIEAIADRLKLQKVHATDAESGVPFINASSGIELR